MTLKTGDVLQNRYRIVRLVGQGGFGAVYRAWDINVSQPVALKENLGVGSEAQRQFEREATLLAGLRHPNLPRVTDHFIIPGQGQYLVMDYVEGKSLATLLAERGRPLPEADALAWVRQVCDALTYLHARPSPIIHRDIKPENIIVTADNRAMLVDFGISKVFVAGGQTTVGAMAVTPGFSPPEQYGGGGTDARSDVYALAATLYKLLTAQTPPESVEVMAAEVVVPPAHELNPAVSPAVARAIERAMTPQMSRRTANATTFAEELLSRLAMPLPTAAILAPIAVAERAASPARPEPAPASA
ncbi:MAG TPA: serine/threonine-protein kinase, partial [Promineifilum sp.]|nr:serine/threonine-protein kinase [Promineifilum sp.]